MVSKNSLASILIHLALILILSFAIGWMQTRTDPVFPFILFLFVLLISWRLVRIYQQTNRDIAYFFDAMRNSDSTTYFPVSVKNKSLQMLHQSMNRLNQHISQIKLKNEYKEKYYQALIKQSNTGLAVLNEKDEIELLNDATCQYAGISAASTNRNLLKIRNEEFYRILCRVQAGETLTYKNIREGSVQLLLFKASEFRDRQSSFKLVSIQDIRQELDEKELESYQKLISILTHEIMNSVAPLTSISKTLGKFFISNGNSVLPGAITESVISNTVQGLKVIEDQSNGLMSFVNNYRKLTKIPAPVLVPFDVREWRDQLAVLFSEKFADHAIHFNFAIEDQVTDIIADKNLINQVVVNLLNNAIDSLKDLSSEKRIQMNLSKNTDNRILLKISNNGPQIPNELQEKIFVPFFTTKENGSGIGLSISRQIMRLHKGSISVISEENGDTVFILEL